MPKRYTPKVYETLYRFIAARDGERCLVCGRTPPAVRLQIDHADNNPMNWAPDNLHLLCQRCNDRKRSLTTREQVKLVRHYSALRVREREREIGEKNIPEVRDLIDYRSGSTEMAANSHYEPLYRDFVIEVLRKQGQAEKNQIGEPGRHHGRQDPSVSQREAETI